MKFRFTPKSELVSTMLQNRDGDVKGYRRVLVVGNSRFLALARNDKIFFEI
jgi:hypothetical protein